MADRLLVKNGCIISLDDVIGNFKQADMLIEGNMIVAVAPEIEAGDCEVVDATNKIVMPGFVDTHRHTWEAIVRNIGTDWSLMQYLDHIYYGNIGDKLRPQDGYIANLIGALEALNAGVTTILDWSMINSPEHTDELIHGLQDSGIRAVFAYGTSGDRALWSRESQIRHSEDSRRVKKQYFSSDDQLVTMGLAIRGPEFSAWDTAVDDIMLAKELDVLCSMHLGFGTWGSIDHSITKLYQAGLLSPQLNFAHANTIHAEEYKLIADAGASISVTPEIEMMMGHGYPATGRFMETGGKPTLGVDVVVSTGGDMFTQMKFALQAERARMNETILSSGEMPTKLALSAKRILKAATIHGAEALGLAHVGSLAPGKAADFIMISRDDINMFPINDPVGAIVQCVNPSNVDSVYVAGKAVKQNGKLLNVDMARLRGLADEARDYIFSRYNISPEAVLL